MRLGQATNNRPDRVIAAVKNSESTSTIPRGTPVILNLSSAAQPTSAADGSAVGYEDGLQVVLPATQAATPTALFTYGVAMADIAAGQYGESLVFGVTSYALVVRATRAASTDSWTSSQSASSAGGYLLSVRTQDNAFMTITPSSISLANASSIVTTSGIDIQKIVVQAVMLDSFASMAASASNTSDTRTAVVLGYRAFVRYM